MAVSTPAGMTSRHRKALRLIHSGVVTYDSAFHTGKGRYQSENYRWEETGEMLKVKSLIGWGLARLTSKQVGFRRVVEVTDLGRVVLAENADSRLPVKL